MSRLSKIIRAVMRRTSRRPLGPPTGPKPPLLLHIGPHKTGTTAIQVFCERNRKPLARAGFWYPEVGALLSQHLLLPACYLEGHPCIDNRFLGGDPEELVATLASERPRTLTPLMSSEVFWELLGRDTGDFESVIGLLGQQFQVHIVLVERPLSERLWSGIKHNCRHGVGFDAVTQLRIGAELDGQALARIGRVGCPVIRIPYDHDDCVTSFLAAISLQRLPGHTDRPKQMSELITRTHEESSKLRLNVAPQESWFVAFTIEFSRRLLLARGPQQCDSSRSAFLAQVLTIGNEIAQSRLLPGEDAILRRVAEGRGSLSGLLDVKEVQAWSAICEHPAVQLAAMRTGCIADLRAVSHLVHKPRMAA
jgi:hypothetical protein